MPKRTKKYNPLKMATIANERKLKNVAVSYFVNDNNRDEQPMIINLNGDFLPITKKLADEIQMFPYRWSVMLCIFCIEKGMATIKMELAPFKKRDYQRNLVVELNDIHQAYVAKQKAMNVHITGVGWLASPVCRDFPEDEVGHIFEKLGAF